jgi:hypothetical protein
MGWSRLWDDVLGDPKLLRAARRGMQELELLPWLQAFASQAADGGRLTIGDEPADPEDIAGLIPGMTAERVATALAALTEIGVLTVDSDGAKRFAAWKKRQEPGKPSDARDRTAERKRRQRAKDKTDNALGDADSPTQSGRDMSRPTVTRDMSRHQSRAEQSRTEQSRAEADVTPAAAAAASSAAPDALALAVAANTAITARWGEQPAPLLATGGAAHVLACAVADAGIPVPFACQVIADVVARSDADRPPRSLKYFAGAITDAWEAETMRAAVQSARIGGAPPTAAALHERLDTLARAAWWDEACCRHGWHHLELADRPRWIERQRASGFLPAEIPETQLLGEAHLLDQARLIVTGLYNTRTQEQVRREFHRVLAAASGVQAA